MGKLSEAIEGKPVTALIYGQSGSGKTTTWSEMTKFPDVFCPIYCMDFDLRLDSLRVRRSKEEMDRIYFDSYRDLNIQGESFLKAQFIANDVKKVDKKYGVEFKTIIVDSATFFMRSLMNRCLYLDGGKSSATPPQLQNYNLQMSEMGDFVSKLVGCGRHVIFTVHEKNLEDKVTGKLTKVVDLTGDKSPDRIPGFFNEYWHCELRLKAGGESEFVVRTKSDVFYGARTSFRTLQGVEKQEEIWGKIVKELSGAQT